MKINIVKKNHKAIFYTLSPKMLTLTLGNRVLEVSF